MCASTTYIEIIYHPFCFHGTVIGAPHPREVIFPKPNLYRVQGKVAALCVETEEA